MTRARADTRVFMCTDRSTFARARTRTRTLRRPYGRDRPCKESCKEADKAIRKLRAAYHPDHVLKAFDCEKGAINKSDLDNWALEYVRRLILFFLNPSFVWKISCAETGAGKVWPS